MSVVAGQRYSGAWDDGSYRYDLVLGFTAVDRKHNVEGTTEWTHRSGLSGVSMDLSVFPAEALEFSAWTEQQWQGMEELAARSPSCFQVQSFPSTRLRGFVW